MTRTIAILLTPLLLATIAAAAPQGVAQRGRGGPGRIGGPGSGPPLPPPPIAGSMPPAELSAALDDYIAKLASSGDFAGVVLVAKDGVTIFEKGYGLADRERKIPNTPDVRFNVASIGKAMTRAAIAQLAGQGKLALTDTIGMRLPDYPNADAKAATIDQLLTHAVGIVDIFDPRFASRTDAGPTSNAHYFRMVAPEPLLFAPGADTQYCNGCYIVLGEIVAKVSGMPYEQYVTERIFRPAGMTGAGFLSYGEPKVALGYEREGDQLVHRTAEDGRRGSAAGGVFMRAADLLAFDTAIRDGRLLNPKMTAWYLRLTEEPKGRASGRNAIAGGTGGANAVMDATAAWGVFVVSNLDPPAANRLAPAIVGALNK
jgi:D-alanyl-D-alanine carboxypeptidase